MEILETKITPKNADFYCKKCHFMCSKMCDWIRHLNTKKHTYRLSGNNLDPMEIKKTPTHICRCGKKYTSSSGLWKHKKSCTYEEENEILISEPHIEFTITSDPNQLSIITELFQEQLKENKELKEMLIEQNKKLIELAEKSHGQITNITNNNNTNNFNLQFFLNEQCKDALNIMDFINQLQLKTSDLDMVG
jgi:hypothetical protein